MFGRQLKEKARSLPIAADSNYAAIQQLIIEGGLDQPLSSAGVAHLIRESRGVHLRTAYVQPYMKKFLLAGIIRAVKPAGTRDNFWVLASVPRSIAIRAIAQIQSATNPTGALFSRDLTNKLKKYCRHELQELQDNYGKNGNCSAFLLRKILEKLIIIAFSKNHKEHFLQDPARPGGWKGLKDLIEVAAREKIDGISFMVPKTASEIKGVKFLGDTAAHNPLVGVDMPSIVPQMPFVVTAYKELARRL
jgi:hypothetical protein